jgi:hypothetical protein
MHRHGLIIASSLYGSLSSFLRPVFKMLVSVSTLICAIYVPENYP